MRDVRIKMKCVENGESVGLGMTFKNVWEVQELVRIHMWPLPKTWITRTVWDDPRDALLALGGMVSENPYD